MMQRILFLLILTIGLSKVRVYSQVNPTGTYIIGDGLQQGNSNKKGYFGEIRIKRLSKRKIAVALFVSSGYPGYNSGSFVDTLDYNKSSSTYTNSHFDSTCQIHFTFSSTFLSIKQSSKIYPSPCGFGWDVIATGTYKKVSSKIPIIKDLAKNY